MGGPGVVIAPAVPHCSRPHSGGAKTKSPPSEGSSQATKSRLVVPCCTRAVWTAKQPSVAQAGQVLLLAVVAFLQPPAWGSCPGSWRWTAKQPSVAQAGQVLLLAVVAFLQPPAWGSCPGSWRSWLSQVTRILIPDSSAGSLRPKRSQSTGTGSCESSGACAAGGGPRILARRLCGLGSTPASCGTARAGRGDSGSRS